MPEDSPVLKLVVVSSNDLLVLGLSSVIHNHGRNRIVGIAGNTQESITLVKELTPDAVVMDCDMQEGHIISTIAEFKALTCPPKIILIQMEDRIDNLPKAFLLGGDAFLTKTSSTEGIVSAIEAVMWSETVIQSNLFARIVERLQHLWSINNIGTPAHEHLTKREIEVLYGMAKGYTNKQIASQMGIGARTVKAHISGVFAKLGARNRAQAALIAKERGLL